MGEAPQRAGSGAGDAGAGRVETDAPELFAAELKELAPRLPDRLDAEPEDIDKGLARLVLTLIEFIRQLLEHQAVRRMEGGGLTEAEVERLGLALMRLEDRLEELRSSFGIEEGDLNIDLGPLGRLL